MPHNGLALGAVADFGAQNFHLTTNVDARQNAQLTTSPAIEPNACYVPLFFAYIYYSVTFFSPNICLFVEFVNMFA